MEREIKDLQQQLKSEKRKQSRSENLAREIKTKRELAAKELVDKYKREVEAQLPEAEKAISNIIQPWFLNLKESETYQELLDWSKQHDESVSLTHDLYYYWPKRALAELAQADQERLSYARFTVKNHIDEDLHGDFKSDFDWDQVWQAGFEVESLKYRKTQGLKIWRQPTVGMGFGFAMIRSEYDIWVNPENVIDSINRISPEVWIKFGEQIETGKVWRNIKESLKPQKGPLKTENGDVYRERIRKIADKYLKERTWH